MSERCLIYAPQEDMAGVCANCGENRYAHDDGVKAEPAPPAPPAAPAITITVDPVDEHNAKEIARLQSKLARVESELEKLRVLLQEYERESPKHGGDGWDIRFRLKQVAPSCHCPVLAQAYNVR